MSKPVFDRIMAGLKEALGIARGEIPVERVWHVDRDGRVRTDKDRPVVLRAVKSSGLQGMGRN